MAKIPTRAVMTKGAEVLKDEYAAHFNIGQLAANIAVGAKDALKTFEHMRRRGIAALKDQPPVKPVRKLLW